jgi:hypothetical protein
MAREKFEATDRSVSDAYESRQLVGAIFSYANYQNDDLREVCIRLIASGDCTIARWGSGDARSQKRSAD